MSFDGILQKICLILAAALQVLMVRLKIFYHFFYIRSVLGRLEGVGLKVLVISGEVKGVGAEPVSYTHLDVYKRQDLD